jgi:pilus assembly protein TadC
MILFIILTTIIFIINLAIYWKANSIYKDELLAINKKESKLYPFLPVGFFLQDKIFITNHSNNLNNYIMQLYGKYEYSFRNRLYKAEKISIAYILITVALFFSIISGIMAVNNKEVDYLEKSAFGEGTKTYDYTYEISIGDDILQEAIHIIVPEEKGTAEEGIQLLEAVAAKLPGLILGDNESLSNVEFPLELIERYEDTPIEIDWESQNKDILLSNGEIRAANLMETANPVSLKATLSYYDQSYQETYDVVIYPKVLNNEEKIERIQTEINTLMSTEQLEIRDEKKIQLPEEIIGIIDSSYSIEWMTNSERMNPIFFLAISILITILIVILKDYELKKRGEVRNSKILQQFPEVVNKMTLLINAGMTVSRAFTKICSDYIEYKNSGGATLALYEEMVVTIEDMQKGISEANAYEAFGKRCKLPEILRFTSVIIQNLKKGNDLLVMALRQQSKEAWRLREDLARKKGEKASTKLVLPMGIMLVAIIVIILVPAVLSLKL